MSLFADSFADGTARTATWGTWAALTVVSTRQHKDANGIGSNYAVQRTVGGATPDTTPLFGTGEDWTYSAVYADPGSTRVNIAQFFRSGAATTTVGADPSTGIVTARFLGATGTVFATSAAGLVSAGTYNWFWTFADLQESPNGNLRVYVNGNVVPAINVVAGDTRGGATDGWDQLGYPPGVGANYYTTDILTCTDAEKTAFAVAYPAALLYPELFMPPIVPTSTFLSTFLGPGTFADVDEIPWVTADFMEATAVGQQVLYAAGGLPGGATPGAVFGVISWNYAARDGVVTTWTPQVQSVAATASAAAIVLGGVGTYTQREGIFLTDPNTGTVWAWPAASAARWGGTFG